MEEHNGKAHREGEEQDTIEEVEGEATEDRAVGLEEALAEGEEEEAVEETEDAVNAPYLQSCAVVPHLLPPPSFRIA